MRLPKSQVRSVGPAISATHPNNERSCWQVFSRYMLWFYGVMFKDADGAKGGPGADLPELAWLLLAPEGLTLQHIVKVTRGTAVGVAICIETNELTRMDLNFIATRVVVSSGGRAQDGVQASRAYGDVLLDLRQARARKQVEVEEIAGYLGCYPENVVAMEEGLEPISMPTLHRWLGGLGAHLRIHTGKKATHPPPWKAMWLTSDIYDWCWQQDSSFVDGYAPVPAAFQEPYRGEVPRVPTPEVDLKVVLMPGDVWPGFAKLRVSEIEYVEAGERKTETRPQPRPRPKKQADDLDQISVVPTVPDAAAVPDVLQVPDVPQALPQIPNPPLLPDTPLDTLRARK